METSPMTNATETQTAFQTGRDIFNALPKTFFALDAAKTSMDKIQNDLSLKAEADLATDLARLSAYAEDETLKAVVRTKAEEARAIAKARPAVQQAFLAGLKGQESPPAKKVVGAKPPAPDPLARGQKQTRW